MFVEILLFVIIVLFVTYQKTKKPPNMPPGKPYTIYVLEKYILKYLIYYEYLKNVELLVLYYIIKQEFEHFLPQVHTGFQ